MANGPELPLEVLDCFAKLRDKKVFEYQESCWSVQLTLMDPRGKEGKTAEGGAAEETQQNLRRLRTWEALDVPNAFVAVICASSSKTAAFRIIPRLQWLSGARHGVLRAAYKSGFLKPV